MTTVIAFGLGMLVGGTFGVLMAGVLMASREEGIMNHGLKVNGNVLEITLPDGLDIEKVVVNGKVFSPPQQAGELQKHQRVEQKRRYTFGNDEFSLEAAYHDCKLVFDGITDDESFQGADTGLILYYANEIIYALQEALENKDTNVLSNDTISRQAAIDEFIDELEVIFADLRERHVDDSVCGLCEYDGAYIGESGDWCNECPGFEKDDCFKLSGKIRKEWTDKIIKALPSAEPEPEHTMEEFMYCQDLGSPEDGSL